MLELKIRTLQQAVLEARKRTGRHIGTRVKAGLFQVVEIEKKGGGQCVEKPLFGYSEISDIITYIQSLKNMNSK